MKTIQNFRKDINLTQKEAAKFLNITKEYLSMIETGKRNPSDNLKEKMSQLYKVSVSDIYVAMKNIRISGS